MKNPFVIALLVLLVLWYAFHVLIWRAYGGTWLDGLLWPIKRITGQFTTQPAIGGEVVRGPSLTNADGLPEGSMSLA